MKLLQVIYGAGILVIIYLVIRMLYSVYYTPGVSVIYNSPVAQALFPNERAKLTPNWGYTKPLGLYSDQATKFGQGDFWPSSGKGYVANKKGFSPPSPTGGLRPYYKMIEECSTGWWNGDIDPKKHVNLDIYDSNAEIPKEVTTDVGWWND
jgi:hypothetical protein